MISNRGLFLGRRHHRQKTCGMVARRPPPVGPLAQDEDVEGDEAGTCTVQPALAGSPFATGFSRWKTLYRALKPASAGFLIIGFSHYYVRVI